MVISFNDDPCTNGVVAIDDGIKDELDDELDELVVVVDDFNLSILVNFLSFVLLLAFGYACLTNSSFFDTNTLGAP